MLFIDHILLLLCDQLVTLVTPKMKTHVLCDRCCQFLNYILAKHVFQNIRPTVNPCSPTVLKFASYILYLLHVPPTLLYDCSVHENTIQHALSIGNACQPGSLAVSRISY